MTPRDVIQRKRDGGTLSNKDIAYFIRGYMSGEVADYHMSALLMAVYLNSMNIEETIALTREMRDSGVGLDLSSIPGKTVDKHSTGGVGDKTSLVIAPIVAACGVTVPMITGRALGHTGGTLDKMESIPGFNAQPTPKKILEILRRYGAVIMGQTKDLAPADRKMYALRDVTGTVESIPLITASILSKKLAEGLDGLVMDVKTGSGAFMPTLQRAKALSDSIVYVCRKMKTKCVVVITSMDEPLGRAVGNANEVRECIDFLKGHSPADLEEVAIALSAHMIRLGGRARTFDLAAEMARRAVASGEAARCFQAIVKAQGGNEHVVDDPEILPKAVHTHTFKAAQAGFITRCDAKLLGLASNALGAGRAGVQDTIDPAAGIYLEKKVGDRAARGETLCTLHWNDESRLRRALPLVREAYEIRERPISRQPLIRAVLGT